MCVCVCVNKPQILDELKRAIREKITKISRAMVKKLGANFHDSLQNGVNEKEHHKINVAFHT